MMVQTWMRFRWKPLLFCADCKILERPGVMVHRLLRFLCRPNEVGFDLNRDGLRLNHPQAVSLCFDVELFPLARSPLKCKRDGHRVKLPNFE